MKRFVKRSRDGKLWIFDYKTKMWVEWDAESIDFYVQRLNAGHNIRMGALLLDRIYPDWFKHIDADRLNLDSATNCVLGQLHGGIFDVPTGTGTLFDREYGYWHALDNLIAAGHNADAFMLRYGFLIPGDNGLEDHCHYVWRAQIKARQES